MNDLGITKPTLLIDESKCRRNIAAMKARAVNFGLAFRPHFKTHQSLEIGRWFKDEGVDKITVSSVSMAKYFAPEWNDITIAFPVNIREIDEINKLASKLSLNLLVESLYVLDFLQKHLESSVGIFIKIDVGYHRTGMNPKGIDEIEKVIALCAGSPKTTFKGFLSHSGHTYSCHSSEEINEVHTSVLQVMDKLKRHFIGEYPGLLVSLGDTPSCSVAENFSGVDEIRPGNFVFYDLMQYQIGSCNIDEIACAIACPIVAKNKERLSYTIYGGGVHLSKDRLEWGRTPFYGGIVSDEGEHWGYFIPGMYVKSLSQEHGIVKVPADVFDQYEIGDILFILPVHSCMTADLMRGYYTLEGRYIEKDY